MKRKNQNKLKKGLLYGLTIGIVSNGFIIPTPHFDINVVYANQENSRDTSFHNELSIEEYLKKSWNERKTEIDIESYQLTSEQMNTIVFNIHYENPEYYYVLLDNGFVDENKDGIIETYIQKYPLDRSAELEEEWKIVEDKVQACKTDLEKALVVHDHLCETITYTEQLGRSAHDIEGAILEKKAVCEGYALAFKFYMNRLNIPCNVVSGMASGGPHAWNQVQIDGQWYMVDATFDDPKNPTRVGHDNFLVSESVLKRTHTWTRENYELCTDTKFDQMFWQKCDRRLDAWQGKIYYPKIVMDSNNPYGYIAGIYRYDVETGSSEPTPVIEVDEWWKSPDGQMSKDKTTIDIKDGILYYALPTSIWKKDLGKNDKPVKIFDLENNDGKSIWDISVLNGKVYYRAAVAEHATAQDIHYDSVVIDDSSFTKLTQPVSVSSMEVRVVLGAEDVILEAAAPGKITYTSKDPNIVEGVAGYNDTCSLKPKKEGTTMIIVKADETDRYTGKEVSVIVHVVKNTADVYFAEDKMQTELNKHIFSGDVYVAANSGKHTKPTGQVSFNVFRDGKKLLAQDKVIPLDQNKVSYSLEVPAGNGKYEVVCTYNGDVNYASKEMKKEYTIGSQHTHVFNREVAEERFKASDATCTKPAMYYKSCECGEISTETFHYGQPLGHQCDGKVTWVWSKEHQSATVNYQCSVCQEEQTVDAAVTKKVLEAPTCVKKGTTRYTAKVTISGQEYSEFKDIVNLKQLEHRWDEKFIVDREPTCTQPGSKSIHCKDCDATKDVTEIAKIAHKFENGKCVWCGQRVIDENQEQDALQSAAPTGDVATSRFWMILLGVSMFPIAYFAKKKSKKKD